MQRILSYFASAFTNIRSPPLSYTLLGRLDGHSGAVNCISFTRDGMLLASGGKFPVSLVIVGTQRSTMTGDDETVRVWDIETLVNLQVIRDPDENWGQITCLVWFPCGAGQEGNVLCFGTGRGHVNIFRRNGNLASHKFCGIYCMDN